MPRSTRSAVLACALLVALASGTLSSCAQGSDDTVFSGRFSPDSPIRLVNRTILGGAYTVGYSMDVLFSPARNAVTLTCTIIDTSGRIEGFNGMSRTIVAGEWTRVEAQNRYDLPDLTLGIRCSPDTRELLTAEFRNVTLTVTPG